MKRTGYLLIVLTTFFIACATRNSGDFSSKSSTKKNSTESPAVRLKISKTYVDAATQQVLNNLNEALQLYQEVTLLDPDNHAAFYNIGLISIQKGDVEGAIRNLKKAVSLNNENYWYQKGLVDAYERNLEFSRSIETQKKLVENFPENLTEKLRLAELYQQNKDFDSALKLYEEVKNGQFTDEDIALRRYQLYIQKKQFDLAVQEAELLIRSNPGETEFYQLLHEGYLLLNNKEKALEVLHQLLKVAPNNGYAILALVDYYKDSGDLTKADGYLNEAFRNENISLENKIQILGNLYYMAEKDTTYNVRIKNLTQILFKQYPESALVYGLKADVLYQEGKLDSALHYYHLAVKSEPTNEKIWQQLLLLESEKENYQLLYKDSEKALEYFPNQSLFLFLYATAANQIKDFTAAIYGFEKLKKLKVSNPELMLQTYSQLGTIYNDQKNFSKSDENFELALSVFPENSMVLNNYAYFLSVRNENLDKAEQMILIALKNNPNSASYQDTYGWVLFQKQDYHKAEQWIKKSVDNGGSPEVLLHYSAVLEKLGRHEESEIYKTKAREASNTTSTEFLKEKSKK